jgi:hypothetical protein
VGPSNGQDVLEKKRIINPTGIRASNHPVRRLDAKPTTFSCLHFVSKVLCTSLKAFGGGRDGGVTRLTPNRGTLLMCHQLHAPAALSPAIQPQLPSEWEAGWIQSRSWSCGEQKHPSSLAGIDPQIIEPVA